MKQEIHDIDGPPVTGTPVGSMTAKRLAELFLHFGKPRALSCVFLTFNVVKLHENPEYQL